MCNEQFWLIERTLIKLNLDINDCQSNPCIHGTCVDQLKKYICTCDGGYTGRNCETGAAICVLHS